MSQKFQLAPNHAITLSEKEIKQLETIIRKQTNPQHIVLRANIILMANNGLNIIQSARQLRVAVNTIKLWRRRWNERLDLPTDNRLVDKQHKGQVFIVDANNIRVRSSLLTQTT